MTAAHAIIAAYRSGASLRQLVRDFGIGVTTAHSILRGHGEPRRDPGYHRQPPTAAQLKRDAHCIAAYRATRSMHAVARQLGISTSTVWRVLAGHNAPRRQR
jgi:hypothetical protein